MDYIKLLREMLQNDEADFREGQLEAIKSAVAGKRTLVVEKTGWGKSIVYFLATKVLRDQGKGITLIISPLISLMDDQIKHAENMGLRVFTINSQNTTEHKHIYEILANKELDALIISPERLANQEFRRVILEHTGDVGLFVVDEAHCISDWGHDFRPDYRRIVEIIGKIPSTVPVLATTATANDRVVEDIEKQIPGIVVVRGSLLRESLALQAINIEDFRERVAWIGKNLELFDGPGIIYCSTVANCELLDRYLKGIGKRSAKYIGDMGPEERQEVIDGFKGSEENPREIDVVVATVALGMGFDMPDLKYVIHFERPSNVIAYYQQIGRAGRNIPSAYAVMLYGETDDIVQKYFIETAFPQEELMSEIIRVTTENQENGTKAAEYEKVINAGRAEIGACLKFLEVEGDIYKEGSCYYKSAKPFDPHKDRIANVTERKYAELEKIREYCSTKECNMKFLAEALDDRNPCNCGKCSNCIGHDVLPFMTPTAEEIEAVEEFINNSVTIIEARKIWPNIPEILAAAESVNSKIAEAVRTEDGVCLSRYGDAGYGKLVKKGKYTDKEFSDELVDASEKVLREFIEENEIRWVTAIASLNNPELVRSFAKRLAEKLGLPYKEAIVKTKATKQQKEFNNSYHQCKNVMESFAVTEAEVDAGNVLLVDDMVDSRWTFAVCGFKLRKAGSGKVYPFALANTSRAGE